MDLQTSDDHFNYGVERLNARDMDVARKHLDRALAMEPNGEHILFTLALCCGLAGDGAGGVREPETGDSAGAEEPSAGAAGS